MKHDAILSDVPFVKVGWRACGVIGEDSAKRFRDGQQVMTSPVVWVMVDGDKTYIRTQTTTYLVTKMHYKTALDIDV